MLLDRGRFHSKLTSKGVCFYCQTKLCLVIPNYILFRQECCAQESLYLHGILSDINETGTSFLVCKHITC